MQTYRSVKVISNTEIINIINQSMTGLGVQPPYLEQLIPDSYLPENTGNFVLKGSFFTPDMLVEIPDQIINSKTFISDNEFLINVTTNSQEGYYDLILNNGYVSTYNEALLIVLGEVYTPISSDFSLVSGSGQPEYGNLRSIQENTTGVFDFLPQIDVTKDWRIQFNLVNSQFTNPYDAGGDVKLIEFFDILTDEILFYYWTRPQGYDSKLYTGVLGSDTNQYQFLDFLDGKFKGRITIQSIHNVYKFKIDNQSFKIFKNGSLPNNLKLRFTVRWQDIENFKLIYLNT